MPSKDATTKLTHTAKGYCRTIGHYIHDGKRVPRRFWLGHDRLQAQRKAKALQSVWDDLPGDRGTKVWTEEAINQALDSIKCPQPQTLTVNPESNIPQSMPVFAPRPVPPPTPARTYTLFEALDEFTSGFSERTDIGQKHRDGTKSRIESIKNHINDISIRNNNGELIHLKDLPVSLVDMEWMGRIRNRITSRPMSKHIYDTPKPISIDCVKNWLMTLAMAFDWLGPSRIEPSMEPRRATRTIV